MYWFYILALLPCLAGLILWLKSDKICWQEWIGGSIFAFILAGVFHIAAAKGMTDDIELLSGQVVQVEEHPEWVEQWTQVHIETYSCGTDANGNSITCTRTYTTTEYDTHPLHWEAAISFGNWQRNWDISYEKYIEIQRQFGGKYQNGPKQDFNHGGSFYSGDNNTYVTANEKDVIVPATTQVHFENRIKASPSVFSFAPVPTNIPVFAYPYSYQLFASERLLGNARNDIDLLAFDQLNARLGPPKRINLIMVGFGAKDSSIAEWQRAAWIGGKKNDLVLCYGDTWAKVFGWTESELVKRNLESILLDNKKNNAILPLIEAEVRANYKLKDWSKFDYIAIKPRAVHIGWYIAMTLITQVGLHVFFLRNEYRKGMRTFRTDFRY
jgi:hypothetical protein